MSKHTTAEPEGSSSFTSSTVDFIRIIFSLLSAYPSAVVPIVHAALSPVKIPHFTSTGQALQFSKHATPIQIMVIHYRYLKFRQRFKYHIKTKNYDAAMKIMFKAQFYREALKPLYQK